jgi:hypothetical protein
MSDIFVSYARSNRDRVGPIVRVLESLGWTIWWDPNIPSGTEFDNEISAQIAAAKCVLVIWSKESVQSHWVRGESREGLKRGIAVPILLDAIEPPIDFRSVHSMDFSSWRGDAESVEIVQLRESISRILDRPPTPQGPAALKREQGLRRRIKTLRIVAAALVGVLILVVALNYRTIGRGFEMAAGTVYALETARPFTPDFAQAFTERVGLLKDTLSNQVASYVEKKTTDAWALGQMMSSSDSNAPLESRVFETLLPAAFDAKCECWNPVDGGQHAVATAWIILAHVAKGRPIEPAVIEHLIGAQWPNGSWPLYFDAEPLDDHSSTYATALLALALHEYRNVNSVPGELRARLDASVARAGGWLFAHRPKAGGQWSDYPDSTVRPIRTKGLSALVTFVMLHVFHDQRADVVFSDWRKSLHHAGAFDALDSSDQYVDLGTGGARHDGSRYIVFAWELAALAEGYTWLDWRGRAAAQWYLSDMLSRWTLDPTSTQLEFVVAESVYALRQAARAAGLK